MAFELRDYQVEAVHEVESVLAFDNQAVVTIATGGGKSAVISALALDYAKSGYNVVVLTNLTALIPQLSNHLTELGIPHNIVKAGSHRTEPDANVWLVMEQSFHSNKREEMSINCDLLIKDEFHIGKGQKRYEDIVRDLSPQWTIGFTATAMDEKGYLMHGVDTSQMVNTGDMKRLTQEGWLSPLKFFVPHWAEDVDYTSLSNSSNDYTTDDLNSIIDTAQHTELVIKSMEEMNAKDKKTLVYATSIEHADTIHQELVKHGYSARVVHSGINSGTNACSIAHFKDDFESQETSLLPDEENKEVNCLVSVNSLLIGFDAPNVQLLVILRPTKVRRLWIQCAGRGTRLFPGKQHCEVLDLAQCVKEHGFPDEYFPLIQKGDKKNMAKAKDDAQCDVLSTIVEEKPTQVSREMVIEKMEELLQKAVNIKTMTMKELIGFFDITSDSKAIINVACEIAFRTKRAYYDMNQVNFINEQWIIMIEDFPEYRGRLLRTLRTMSKNKVHAGKKLSALHYVVKYPDGWLRQQSPFDQLVKEF